MLMKFRFSTPSSHLPVHIRRGGDLAFVDSLQDLRRCIYEIARPRTLVPFSATAAAAAAGGVGGTVTDTRGVAERARDAKIRYLRGALSTEKEVGNKVTRFVL